MNICHTLQQLSGAYDLWRIFLLSEAQCVCDFKTEACSSSGSHHKKRRRNLTNCVSSTVLYKKRRRCIFLKPVCMWIRQKMRRTICVCEMWQLWGPMKTDPPQGLSYLLVPASRKNKGLSCSLSMTYGLYMFPIMMKSFARQRGLCYVRNGFSS